ncbi:MAG: colanic acid biosynthesis glycosyltransferase WcaL, partial [Candidatus Sedimenticola sp. (ex Thyasira tokunagai)]
AAAGSVPELSEMMRNVLSRDVDELKRMGIAARERVLQRHDISTEADKLIGHFREALEKPAG